ncbi:MAG: cell division protein FtsB [Gammaproteobacteria bacterium]|nr:cell division protein FtsB [Gammaproteobacteria bacterium]
MKWFFASLVGLLLLLQFRLWVGDGGIPEVLHLQEEVAIAKQNKLELEERNDSLEAEVNDLKQGLESIEERARSELGMIGKDEVFYQFIAPPEKESVE